MSQFELIGVLHCHVINIVARPRYWGIIVRWALDILPSLKFSKINIVLSKNSAGSNHIRSVLSWGVTTCLPLLVMSLTVQDTGGRWAPNTVLPSSNLQCVALCVCLITLCAIIPRSSQHTPMYMPIYVSSRQIYYVSILLSFSHLSICTAWAAVTCEFPRCGINKVLSLISN